MALAWSESGREVALATVVAIEGAAPRPLGSRMIIDDTQRFQGSVSGGCIDAAVIEEAAKVIKSGNPVLMPFGEATDSPWAIGLRRSHQSLGRTADRRPVRPLSPDDCSMPATQERRTADRIAGPQPFQGV